MCLRLVYLIVTRVFSWLRLSRRGQAWKSAEILLLRHQLTVLQRQTRARPKMTWADRALIAALLELIPRRRHASLRLIITPETVLRWRRDVLRRRWAPKSQHKRPGHQLPTTTSPGWSFGWLGRTRVMWSRGLCGAWRLSRWPHCLVSADASHKVCVGATLHLHHKSWRCDQVLARSRQHHQHKRVYRDRHGDETQSNRTLPTSFPIPKVKAAGTSATTSSNGSNTSEHQEVMWSCDGYCAGSR